MGRAVRVPESYFFWRNSKSSLGSIAVNVADNVPKVRATELLTRVSIILSCDRVIMYSSQVHDSVQVDIATGKIQDTIRFDTGNLCMITGGANSGRVGTIMSRERHQGSFDIVHIKDSNGHVFATRLGYVFVIGKGNKPYISLPKGKGLKLTIAEERDKRLGGK